MHSCLRLGLKACTCIPHTNPASALPLHLPEQPLLLLPIRSHRFIAIPVPAPTAILLLIAQAPAQAHIRHLPTQSACTGSARVLLDHALRGGLRLGGRGDWWGTHWRDPVSDVEDAAVSAVHDYDSDRFRQGNVEGVE